ncbi:RBR-type E3 ubiquitin transferase [Entamoeba marina]
MSLPLTPPQNSQNTDNTMEEDLVPSQSEGVDVFTCPKCFHICNQINENDYPKVNCPECNKFYCVKCKVEWHDNSTCEKYQEWKKDQESSEQKYKEFISKYCRPCPHCQTQIEKNGGCQWMHCSHCNGYFCWRCMNKSYDHRHFPETECKKWTFKDSIETETTQD